MQSQSKLSEDFQELLDYLIVLHPDLDLKLTQPQYDDDLDILRAVYLKVTLKALSLKEISEQELKPLDQLTNNEFLQAKISYLTVLRAQKMEEQETSEVEIDELIQVTEEAIQKYQNYPKRLAGSMEALKELQFIKSVSYALQQTQRKLNQQEEAAQVMEEKNDIDVLMNQWNEIHDPITDSDSELQEIQDSIQRYRQRNQVRQLKKEEEKLALLLQIIQARQPLNQQSNFFYDQPDVANELQSLADELELDNVQSALAELTFCEARRPKLLNRSYQLEELDLKIQKLKRLIQLFEIKIQRQPQGDDIWRGLNNQIDYSNAYEIPEVDLKNCQQDYAVERARNAMNHDKDMPECFQMSITKVIYLANLLLYDQQDDILEELTQSQMKEQLALNLGMLINHYMNEGLENQDIKKLFLEVQHYGNSRNELEKIIKNINSAQIKHRVFNFREFKELLSLNERSAQALVNKNITILLGGTGCGKSTTVHYLCGSKMKLTQYDNLFHIQPSLLINQDLIKVKCSPLAISETRYVTPIEINLAQLGQNEDQVITVVDTPGSQDNESFEVEISNGLGIQRAVRQSKGVRLVLIFSYLKFGARGEELKKLIAFYAWMLKNLDRHLHAFSFFFTHVPQEVSIDNLRALLEDGLNQLTEQEKQNENLVILFRDIIEKAQAAEDGISQHVHILRPLDCNPIHIHRSILQSSPIEDTSSFLERIDERGKFQVFQQFKMHGEAIISAIKRNDAKYAIYLFEDLLSIQKVFPQDYVLKYNFKYITEEVIQFGQQLFKLGMQSFQKAFNVSEDNNLTIKDFQKFELSFVQAKSAIDPFYSTIQNLFLRKTNSSCQNLFSFEYINYLRELLEESFEQVILKTNDIANPLWNRYINKYMLSLQYFSSSKIMQDDDGFLQFLDEKIIGRLQKVFYEAVDKLTHETRLIIQNMTLTNCTTVIEDTNKSPIKQISHNLSQLVAAQNKIEEQFFNNALNQSIKALYSLIKQQCNHLRDLQLRDIIDVIDHFKNFYEQIVSEEEQQFFEEDFFFEITPIHVTNITNFFLMHQKLSSRLELIINIDYRFLQELEDDIIDLKQKFLQFYFHNEEKLKSVITKKASKHRNIKKAFDQIKSLRKISFIENETFIGFQDVISLFEQLLDNKTELLKSLIPDIDKLIQVKSSKLASPFSKFKEALIQLMDLKDILPQRNYLFLMIFEEISIKLTQLADNLKQEAQQNYFSFEDITVIKRLDKIYQYINNIKQIAQIINCHQISYIDLNDIKRRFEELLNQIERFLIKKQDSQQLNAEGSQKYDAILINRNQCSKISQMLIFLKIMNKKITLSKELGLLQQIKKLQNDFIKFIEQNARFQLIFFDINYQTIKQIFRVGAPILKQNYQEIDQEGVSNILILENQVNDAVKNICDRLQTFKEIRTYHEQLYQHFDRDMDAEEYMIDKLHGFLQLLSQQMESIRLINPIQYNINFTLLPGLLVIDKIIQSKENFGVSFEKIHMEAFEIFIQNQGQSENDADIALTQQNYYWFNEIISNEYQIEKFNKHNTSFKQIHKKLEDHISKLEEKILRNIKLSMNSQEYENSIEKLYEDAIQIIEVLQNIKKEILGNQNCKKLEYTLVKFHSYLNTQSEMIIQKSAIFIREQKYYEAYKMIKESLNMLNPMSLISEEHQDIVKKLVKDANQKIEELNQQLKFLHCKISEEANNIEQCRNPIEFMSMNLNQICCDLEKIIDQKDFRDFNFELEYYKIMKSIKKIYENSLFKLEEIVYQKDNITASFDNILDIQQIKKSLAYVSKKIIPELLPQIERIEIHIQQQIEQISKNLYEILTDEDVEKNILKLDFKYLSHLLDHRFLNLEPYFKDLVDKNCLRMVEHFEDRLKYDNLTDVFDQCLSKFYDIQSLFIQPHLKFETKKRIQDLEQNILLIFSELQTVLITQFQSLTTQSQKQYLIEIKSFHLQKSRFLPSFSSFMKIPLEIQSKLNPQFQEQIVKITNIGFLNLNNAKNKFDGFIKDNQFDESIRILKLHEQHIDVALQCLRDQNYLRYCSQMNDPEINQKIQFIQQYSVDGMIQCHEQKYNKWLKTKKPDQLN